MKIRELNLVAVGCALMVGVANAEWGKGLGHEHKGSYVPMNQQSGWESQPTSTEETAAAPVAVAKAIPQDNWTLSGIKFELGSDIIETESQATLDDAADILKSHSRVVVEIQGHTDDLGSPEANQSLSEKRAQAVREYLLQKGIEAERLEAKGYGESLPIADNSSIEGRSQNRRIQFKIKNQ